MRFILLFQCFLLSIPAFAQNEGGPIGKSTLEFKKLFSTTLKEGIACYRIPAIITAQNGDLIAAIDERVSSCGDLRSNKDINIVARRSKDNGESWSEMETIVDYPFGESASDPSMILDEVTGEIFLFFNYMDLEKENGIYYLKMIKSRDHGQSWSAPLDLTAQISKPEWKKDFKFITSGKGIQTDSGRLLHTLVNLEKGLHLFGSDDHGQNWFLIDSPIQPGDESKLVELSDGSWMINSRVNKKGLRFVHTSEDHGQNWLSQADSALIDPACNASFIRYTSTDDGWDKNRLLFSNAKRTDARANISVRISYDEGQTWTAGKTIYSGKSAYSSLCILKNGDIGLFFEKDDYQENVFARFSLEWLTDGEDRLLKKH